MADFAKRPEITVSTMVGSFTSEFASQRAEKSYESRMPRHQRLVIVGRNIIAKHDKEVPKQALRSHKCNPSTLLLEQFESLTHCLFSIVPKMNVLLPHNNKSSSQGKVHNPSGEGVRAISSQAQAKAAKHAEKKNGVPHKIVVNSSDEQHETRVKEGSDKRNITRKKTADRVSGNYNSMHKKQGGHGKGQWKDVMDPSYAEKIPIDEKDPLYDEAEDSTKYILSSIDQEADKRGYDPGTSKAIYGPMLTLSEFKVQLSECINEYFDSCDADEVIRTLDELGCKEYHSEIVKKAVSLSMDKGPRERELVSRLLASLHPTPLGSGDMQRGFDKLLNSLEDLCTDVPGAAVSFASSLSLLRFVFA